MRTGRPPVKFLLKIFCRGITVRPTVSPLGSEAVSSSKQSDFTNPITHAFSTSIRVMDETPENNP
jgi:hypothetical protein